MDTAIPPHRNLEVGEVQEAVTERAATAWDENTGHDENLHSRSLGAGVHPESVGQQSTSHLHDVEHAQQLSSIVSEEDELGEIEESEAVGEAEGAGGLLQVGAAGLQPVVLGDLLSDEEEGDFVDPSYSPESNGEDDSGFGPNVVFRLTSDAENADSGDDSSQEVPNTLVSGLLGRIGLRAMLRGGMHRAPR